MTPNTDRIVPSAPELLGGTIMMSQTYRDAHAVGRSRGYDHANYATNVEGRWITDADAESARVETSDYGTVWSFGSDDERSGFLTGFRDGIDAYVAEDVEEWETTGPVDAER